MKHAGIVLALTFSAAALWAQAPAEISSKLDGTITEGEYSVVRIQDGFTIAARLSADSSTLYAAVSARTSGWVALGLGSLKMNGASMTMGFVDGGKPSVSYELGSGHGHSPSPAPGVDSFILESGGTTTLELSLPAGPYVKNGKLKLIAAFGAKDSFTGFHAKRTALELTL